MGKGVSCAAVHLSRSAKVAIAFLVFFSLPAAWPFSVLAQQTDVDKAALKSSKTVSDKRIQSKSQRAIEISESISNKTPEAIVAEISRFIQTTSPKTLSLAEEGLTNLGYERLVDQLAASFLTMSRSGSLSKQFQWSLKVAVAIVPQYKSTIEKTLNELKRAPYMQSQLHSPSQYEDYEKILWNIHVMRNKLNQAKQIAKMCDQQLRPFRNSKKHRKNNANEIVSFDFEFLVEKIEKLAKDLHEREMELRFYRMEDSVGILSASESQKQKLVAGFAIQYDYTALTDFYTNNPVDSISRKSLKDPEMASSIESTMILAREHGAEQIEKGTRLMVGLHWWLRGRYGNGALTYGLVKPKAAMNSQRIMFALQMPSQIKAPDLPSMPHIGRIPTFERRHYYHWAVEKRNVFKTSFVGSKRQTYNLKDIPLGRMPILATRKMDRFY